MGDANPKSREYIVLLISFNCRSLGGELREAFLLTLLGGSRPLPNACPALFSANHQQMGSGHLPSKELHFEIHSTFGGGTECYTFSSLGLSLFTIMAQKTQKRAPPTTQKRRGTARNVMEIILAGIRVLP